MPLKELYVEHDPGGLLGHVDADRQRGVAVLVGGDEVAGTSEAPAELGESKSSCRKMTSHFASSLRDKFAFLFHDFGEEENVEISQ